MTRYYSEALRAEATEILRHHVAATGGWCRGCLALGTSVQADQCEQGQWARVVLHRDSSQGVTRA
jgi:hypothetical protein